MSTKDKFELKFFKGSHLIPNIKNIENLSCSVQDSSIIITELQENIINNVSTLFTNLSLPYELISTETNLKSLKISKDILYPTITKNLFLKLIQELYRTNTDSNQIVSIRLLCNSIISAIFSQIKIISKAQDPLLNIISHFKIRPDFDQVEDHFNELLTNKKWNLFISENIDTFHSIQISINTWLHIVRHPSENLTKFAVFLNKINSKSGIKDFFLTNIPIVTEQSEWNDNDDIINEQKFFLLAITIPQTEKYSNESISENVNVTILESSEIFRYWFAISTLILRDISFGLLKFHNLSLDGFDSNKIKFYDYLKPKLKQFSESCFNPSLIEAFKLLEKNKNEKVSNLLNGIEFYLYNRGSFLEKRFKESKKEFERIPTNKILRKRHNRRKNKLYEYFNLIIFYYQQFLNEITQYRLASGKYSSIEKIIKLDKNLILNNAEDNK